MTISLYQIGEEFAALEAALVESGGELTEEIEAKLDALGEMEQRKVDSYRQVCSRFEYHAKACQAEIDVLSAKANTSLNAAKRLKERLKFYMESRGVTELKGELWSAKIQRNGGKQPLVITAQSGDDIPAHLRLAPEIRPDMDAIRAVLTNGGLTEIAGLARLDPVGTHLRWR